MYDIKELSNIKMAMNDRIQNHKLNFKFIVTRFVWNFLKTSRMTHGKI